MIAEDPDKFKALVQESLRRQVAAINSLADVGKLISKNFQTDDERTNTILKVIRIAYDLLQNISIQAYIFGITVMHFFSRHVELVQM